MCISDKRIRRTRRDGWCRNGGGRLLCWRGRLGKLSVVGLGGLVRCERWKGCGRRDRSTHEVDEGFVEVGDTVPEDVTVGGLDEEGALAYPELCGEV